MTFTFHLGLMLLNFLIALLSNSLANVLKQKQVIMAAQKVAVVLATEIALIHQAPSIFKIYNSWIIPKYFTVKDKKVYLTRIILANNNKEN